ncbi:type II toxin-antitoxin system HicA family toxin [Haloplanus salilacus]|uniref:type II toxin-antitoxin system HicA family toxin n=1 Tax=Haloplanus salilacus TaxID=2949994 RepID=UPI0030CB8D14
MARRSSTDAGGRIRHSPGKWQRTRGDHAILRWEPPEDHDAEARTVPVPLHDEISEGTLRDIADQAGAKDYQEFKAWIDQNR